ncbi:tryptophan halogenase family protein [Glaciecola siphonariae]|uniref:Tryptophan halogenase family protein n=1 Tax=Glaciecola siphonariae TaxID=521012 RepID=A0ABV9LU34_9ALTE
MTSQAHRIVIAGGGTAGWMAANLLQHYWQQLDVEVHLVESAQIGIIGVGEGSTPSLKRFFQTLEIPESEWMEQCNATYKVSIQFNDWSPKAKYNSYQHPFISQVDTFSERRFYVNCYTRRLGLDVETRPEKFLLNGWLANQGKSPLVPPNFPFDVEYGYHFDSGLLGQFLAGRAKQKGVKHTEGNIAQVQTSASGDICALVLQDGQRIEGDLFIDCTGFDSLLLQKTLGVKFNSFKSNLFNDAAVAMPSAAITPLQNQTHASALSHGWAWQIPLTHRTGNGYVYSSDYINAEQAEHELRAKLGLLDADVPVKHLKMKVGQVEQHWAKNCLALGLSQGFIEPLEATALHLVQTAIESFADAYGKGKFTTQHQQSYNQQMTENFEAVRNYIVAHYKLNSRDDSQYWKDNRANNAISDSLKHILQVWFNNGDLQQEIKRQNLSSHFGTASWHCLLAGYGTFPNLAPNQPGKGDLYKDYKLEEFFSGCMLNFSKVASV